MSKTTSAIIFALFGLASLDAVACRTSPPQVEPSPRELAKTSGVVAVIHVERIRPMSPEDEALSERLWTDPPMNVPFRYPGPSVEFSVVSPLKGEFPVESLIWNGTTSCDVILSEGHDYVIFTDMPSAPGDRIVAHYGTFLLDESQHSLAKLAQVESFLNLSGPTHP